MKKVFSFIFVFLIIGCSQKSALDQPTDLISEEQMINIMMDIYIYKQAKPNSPLREEEISNNISFILKNNNISAETFKNSYDYYFLYDEKMELLLDGVKEKLINKLSNEKINKLKEEENEKEKIRLEEEKKIN